MKAKIWTTQTCPYCVKAKKLLTFKGIEYEEMSGFHPDHPTVPYILLNGEPVGGYAELMQYIRNL